MKPKTHTVPEMVSILQYLFRPKPGIPDADLILYEHGTFAVLNKGDATTTTRESLIAAANRLLEPFTEGVVPGTWLGDFSAIRQESPNQPAFDTRFLWVIIHGNNSIMTLVELEEEEENTENENTGVGSETSEVGMGGPLRPLDLVAGFSGRILRTNDALAMNVVWTSHDV
ncbi:hypothetical protein HK100_012569 [Physocladia obscura]|uniref:Uncharacterized protein n=1 Tax=Physocladia obscura TaxID=109957 RepID=A0AAD5T919_9FUNG|nr:hypothetical protein HK100_012569 [Physocladia obscura]